MASSQIYTPRKDNEPLLHQTLSEDNFTDSDRDLAGQRSLSRCHVITLVSVLGAGCLLAGVMMPHLRAFTSGTLDPIAYLSVSTARTHKIVSKSTGKCLDWENVITSLKECDGSNPKEMWTYEDGRVRTPDGGCLDIGGEAIHIWKCDMTHGDAIGSNQHWKFDEKTAQLKPVVRAKDCLAPSYDGAGVSLEPCDADSKVGCLLFLVVGMGVFFFWKKQLAEEQQTRTVKVEEEDLEAAKMAEQPEQPLGQLEQPEEEAPVESDAEQGNQGIGGSPFAEAAAQEQEVGPLAQEGETQEVPPLQGAAQAKADDAEPAAVEMAAGGTEAAAEVEALAAPGEPVAEDVPPAAEVLLPSLEEVAPAAEEAAQEVALAAEEVAPAEAVQATEEVAPAPEEAAPAMEEVAPAAEEAAPAMEEVAPAEAVQAMEEAAPAPEEAAPAPEASAAPAEAAEEHQEQQPLLEEPQEQAASQDAEQAVPPEANQAAPPPKKKGKGCIVS
eukprot:CAMPEP_0179189380 /NCGR_PEP_ID=MMETSP0796-20121207/94012_1 /TAXON_ID=73915 /ORGANISM="Pyrodinium bahamense, Strain pbaha01" /LENGTH=496 /DNA_ID=CAMNT_0020893513 /DNA_START=67 /DNA_END=1557 /DNA_ORIENTATION=-